MWNLPSRLIWRQTSPKDSPAPFFSAEIISMYFHEGLSFMDWAISPSFLGIAPLNQDSALPGIYQSFKLPCSKENSEEIPSGRLVLKRSPTCVWKQWSKHEMAEWDSSISVCYVPQLLSCCYDMIPWQKQWKGQSVHLGSHFQRFYPIMAEKTWQRLAKAWWQEQDIGWPHCRCIQEIQREQKVGLDYKTARLIPSEYFLQQGSPHDFKTGWGKRCGGLNEMSLIVLGIWIFDP